MLVRPYTPTRPVMPSPPASARSPTPEKEEAAKTERPASPTRGPTPPDSPNHHHPPQHPKPNNTFDLTIKTYFPTPDQPGGALSNLLDCMPLGEEVEIRGPTGDIVYLGGSDFAITNPLSPGGRPRTLHFPRVSMVLGGSGITPGYALMARIVQAGDRTQVRAVDANKSEEDILLKGDLDRFERESAGGVKVLHVLSHAGEEWEGERGKVDAEILRRGLFPPGEGSVVFLCGPPGLVQHVALPALKGMFFCPELGVGLRMRGWVLMSTHVAEWGYVEDENMFGF